MVLGKNLSGRTFLHLLFILAVCVSVFYVGEGNRTKKKRNNSISNDTKKDCDEMAYFDVRQKHMCTKRPELIEIVQKAVKKALTECRRQFKTRRWNCSPLTWTQVFSEGGILKTQSRETAFVQAMTSASVMMEIARSCASGSHKYCRCGDDLRRKENSRVLITDSCPDSFQFGAHYTKHFMDPKKITSRDKMIKSHNHHIGREVVRQQRVRKCKCHGKSCQFLTCWYVSPSIERVGDKIWKLYENAVRSQWNRTTKVLFGPHAPLDSKLTYLTRSENYCVQNLSLGVMGTFGRTCNSTSQGNDGCDMMCCNRPHKKTYVTKQRQCKCMFVWCCEVSRCETCNTTEVVETCL